MNSLAPILDRVNIHRWTIGDLRPRYFTKGVKQPIGFGKSSKRLRLFVTYKTSNIIFGARHQEISFNSFLF